MSALPEGLERLLQGDSPCLTQPVSPVNLFLFVTKPMSKQYNKVIKRKRRHAYLKRRRAAEAAAKKPAAGKSAKK